MMITAFTIPLNCGARSDFSHTGVKNIMVVLFCINGIMKEYLVDGTMSINLCIFVFSMQQLFSATYSTVHAPSFN